MNHAPAKTAQTVTAQTVTLYKPFTAAKQLPIAVPFHRQGINDEIASVVAGLLGTDADNVAILSNRERYTVYFKMDNRRSEQYATEAGLAAYHALTNTAEGKHPAFYGPCVVVEHA